MRRIILILILIIILAGAACRNRLASRLYRCDSENKIALTCETAQYIRNMVFYPETSGEPIQAGPGQVLMTRHSTIDPGDKKVLSGLITTLKETEYRIYAQLPDIIAVDSLDIAGRSACRVIGRYDAPEELWNYYCREGYLVIDTVKSARFHGQLYGKYYNSENDSLIFNGDLNARLKK